DRLGLESTSFGRLLPIGAEAGTATAPWVAGGAVSSLRDYERFCAMLANGGELLGVRVLARESVDRMFRSHTTRMKVRFDGFDGDLAYGLATWLQEPAEGLVRGSDPGAFGFLPWVDRDQGVWGVLALRDRVARVLPRIGAVQDAARAFVKSPAVFGTDEVVRLECGGRTRSYRVHLPPGAAAAAKLPVVMVFHGGGGNGAQIEESTGFSKLADRSGFVAVYPDGTGLLRNKLLTWNSGGIPVYASEKNVDDTAFVRAVLADLMQRVAVDKERVFATGMSNGGMMCHRLAREAADLFAGIAPVSGAMNFTAVDAASPIAVMIVHGSADLHVRYDGGKPERSTGRAGDRVDASVGDAAKYYRARRSRGLSRCRRAGRVERDCRDLGVLRADPQSARRRS
ncbi:MAG: PHB depolymerase family esterase, partial [Planctomycetota bacterium]